MSSEMAGVRGGSLVIMVITRFTFLLLFSFSQSVLGLATGGDCEVGQGKVLMCYFAEWAVHRPSPGDFYVNNVDPRLCTHLVYSYVGMNESTYQLVSRDEIGDYEINGKGMIKEAVALKKKNPCLKVTVSCGGWSEGSVKYSNMAASRTARRTFIHSILTYLRKHKFDGFDLAWEYPGDRGGAFEDRDNFATLLEELRGELNKGGYLLSVQLMGKKFLVEGGYEVPRISNAVHYISLVTYQMNYPASRITGINSPLDSDDEKNARFAVNYILKKGADPSKVLMGFATYGHQYITNRLVTDGKYIGVPANTTYPGPWSKEPGFIGYNEVCYDLTMEKTKWKELWDPASSTPFAVNGRKFVSYDNVRSYKEKLKLVKEKSLAGAMVWSIDTDDFKGVCYGVRFPLINTIKEYLSETSEAEETLLTTTDQPIPPEFIRVRDSEQLES